MRYQGRLLQHSFKMKHLHQKLQILYENSFQNKFDKSIFNYFETPLNFSIYHYNRAKKIREKINFVTSAYQISALLYILSI